VDGSVLLTVTWRKSLISTKRNEGFSVDIDHTILRLRLLRDIRTGCSLHSDV
jgi:hypothetical protein